MTKSILFGTAWCRASKVVAPWGNYTAKHSPSKSDVSTGLGGGEQTVYHLQTELGDKSRIVLGDKSLNRDLFQSGYQPK